VQLLYKSYENNTSLRYLSVCVCVFFTHTLFYLFRLENRLKEKLFSLLGLRVRFFFFLNKVEVPSLIKKMIPKLEYGDTTGPYLEHTQENLNYLPAKQYLESWSKLL
jgi:hypothetical protein